MTKKTFILKNISHEGPDLIEAVLKEYSIDYEIYDLIQTNKLPDIHSIQALIVLGGPQSANDTSHQITAQITLIQEVLRNNVPYLGICLGLQLLAKAAGSYSIKTPIPEIGILDPQGAAFSIELTAAGQSDFLLDQVPHAFPIFQLHGETIEPHPSVTILAKNIFCEHQIIKAGPKQYGIQGHLEVSPNMLRQWIDQDRDLTKLDHFKLLSDFEKIYPTIQSAGTQIFTNFVKLFT